MKAGQSVGGIDGGGQVVIGGVAQGPSDIRVAWLRNLGLFKHLEKRLSRCHYAAKLYLLFYQQSNTGYPSGLSSEEVMTAISR